MNSIIRGSLLPCALTSDHPRRGWSSTCCCQEVQFDRVICTSYVRHQNYRPRRSHDERNYADPATYAPSRPTLPTTLTTFASATGGGRYRFESRLSIYRLKWRHSHLWSQNHLRVVGKGVVIFQLTDEDLSRYLNKTESLSLRKAMVPDRRSDCLHFLAVEHGG